MEKSWVRQGGSELEMMGGSRASKRKRKRGGNGLMGVCSGGILEGDVKTWLLLWIKPEKPLRIEDEWKDLTSVLRVTLASVLRLSEIWAKVLLVFYNLHLTLKIL